MTQAGGWEADVVAALRSLDAGDVAAVELLLLDQIASWILSDANTGGDYDEIAGGVVISALLTAVANAGEFKPEREPAVSDEIALARERFVQGSREYAEHENGIALLVTRLMPAAISELSRNAGNVSQQIYWTFFYGLFVIASGVEGEQDPAVARGVGMTFGEWNTLMADGFRLPGVRR